ncbi:ABC transporter substrate-binding protein [Muricoccus radiodurans]|uniref:ABC transporter substrate-binding protein n=1 Tax=Muricoccus radiodurans TaxID=2231721 RepID=UPI003CEB34DB
MTITRRAGLIGTAMLPLIARRAAAQNAPIKLGLLVPLSGAGGPYGPHQASAVRGVADAVNAAGGVLGRRVEVVVEDDQTNPEAAVRAARKLIDVDRVAAIMGTWASSVTTAVAPLCWESRTMLCTVSGADSITQLPHQGYLIRTQPNTLLQGRKFGEYLLRLNAKRVFVMSPQTPFTQSQFASMKAALERGGAVAELLIYDDKKPTLRSEVDQALRYRPDAIVAAGYTPDTAILLRDLARASFSKPIVGYGYAINQRLIESLPAEIVEGVYALSPSPAEGSPAFARVVAATGQAVPDTYACQTYDHVNLVLLAMAAANDFTGTAVKDNVRRISQGGGTAVSSAVEGLPLLAAGTKIDYDGASGPCDFTDIGDITDVKFRYEQVKSGRITLLEIA